LIVTNAVAVVASLSLPCTMQGESSARIIATIAKRQSVASIARISLLIQTIGTMSQSTKIIDMKKYQTIFVEDLKQARKLADRLCNKGYWFVCQYSHPETGRLFTFSTTIDYMRNNKLLAGTFYELHKNPEQFAD
jgi:hypothetical protein